MAKENKGVSEPPTDCPYCGMLLSEEPKLDWSSDIGDMWHTGCFNCQWYGVISALDEDRKRLVKR
jgi:hypothetical protein